MTKKEIRELKTAKQFLRDLEKGYGTRVCKDISPNCINCQIQYAMGAVREHIYVLEDDK